MPIAYADYNKAIKHIIEKNNYISLATCGEDGAPWVNAVLYVYDSKYNFYFLSSIDSRHGGNILSNGKAAFMIFDSTQPIGSEEEIHGEGTALVIEGKELENAIKLYSKKVFKDQGREAKSIMADYEEPAEFRFFKITVEKFHVHLVDETHEVDPAELLE